MKQTINFSQFHDAFRNMDRLDNFSYQGLRVLYDWFNDYDDDCGTDTELDVIAICCEFSEETTDEIIHNFGLKLRFDKTDIPDSDVLEYLNSHTMVCGQTDTTIIYAAF